MKIGKLEDKLGVWQFMFTFQTRQPHRLGFHPWISLWFVKLHLFPAPGEMITRKKHYEGIHFNFSFKFLRFETYYRTQPLGVMLKWDRKPIPRWIPKWVLMRKCMKPGKRPGEYIVSEPRPGLIKFLSTQFDIPLKITFE